MKYQQIPPEGDPSKIQQRFYRLNLHMICCRFWWLKNWESSSMAFPYWRLYWNKNKGAVIKFKNVTYEIDPEYIYLISPQTPFSTKITGNIKTKKYHLQGERISLTDSEDDLINKKYILHLFLHFTIGLPFDSLAPGVYPIPCHKTLKKRLHRVTTMLKQNYESFSFQQSLDIHALITEALSEIPDKSWNTIMQNKKFLHVLEFIENNLSQKLTNPDLAREAKMATNSFIRLFSEKIGISPQLFIQKKRIESACVQLLYSDYKIEEIALNFGYKDRHYFTRSFKKITGFPPVLYRKTFR